MITIDPSDARPIYVQIADEVKRGIVVGSLAADDPLPSVRQLAEELRVNPNTVQQAYRELEREGVVYIRRGQGTFIATAADSMVSGQRRSLAHRLAKAAVQEAYRNGLGSDELIEAIRMIDENKARPESENSEEV